MSIDTSGLGLAAFLFCVYTKICISEIEMQQGCELLEEESNSPYLSIFKKMPPWNLCAKYIGFGGEQQNKCCQISTHWVLLGSIVSRPRPVIARVY